MIYVFLKTGCLFSNCPYFFSDLSTGWPLISIFLPTVSLRQPKLFYHAPQNSSSLYPLSHSKVTYGGAWVAWSVKHPTSAQVMFSRSVSSSPASGSVLTAQSLEPASDSGSLALSLSAPPLFMLCLSLSQK